jgi:hypothetical protein
MDQNILRVESNGKVFIGGNGKVVCQRSAPIYQNPVLRAVPVLKGSTVGGSLSFNMAIYQDGTNVGDLAWSLQNAPTGVSIDGTTGVITVDEGVAVRSTDGDIRLVVTGATNVPISGPLYMTVDSYAVPDLSGIDPISANASVADVTVDLAAALAGQALAVPVTWSLVDAPAGVTVDPATGRLTVPAGTATSGGSLAVTATDRRGVAGSHRIPYDIVFYNTARLDPTISVSGSTVNGALVVGLTDFQRATDVGSLRWSIQNPPAGVTIDADSGALTVADGVGVTSGSGVVTVSVVGGSGVASNRAALSFAVTTSVVPALSTVPNLDWDVSVTGQTFNVATYLTGSPLASPVEWSIPSGTVPSGISLAADTGILTVAVNTKWNGSFTVVVKDRLGRSSDAATVNIQTIPVVLHVLGKENPFKDNARNRFVGMFGQVTLDSTTFARCDASGKFDGNSHLFASWAADLPLGGDFTVQGWAYPTSTKIMSILSFGHYAFGIMIRPNTPGGDSLWIKGVNVGNINSCFPLNTWKYFTLNRTGNTIRFYANGTLFLTYTNPLGTIYINSSTQIQVGSSVHSPVNEKFIGFLEDIRVVRGIALDGTVVPPAPLSSTVP